MRRVAAAALVVALAGASAACGGVGDSTPHRPIPRQTTTTTTTAAEIPRAPLTDLPDTKGLARGRSSLAVKVENTPEARPQSGLDVADIVYEEVVEGGITRFWAVFNSEAPDHVGPIRSVRRMDPDVVSQFGGVVAYSGGTAPNVALIRRASAAWVDESNAGDAYYRERSRQSPHNLYGRTERLWARGKPVPPAAVFQYLDAGQPFTGDPVGKITLGFQPGYQPTYTFDATARTWKRTYGFVPFLAESRTQIAPTNVVVQFVSYTGGDGQLVGTGSAWVLSGGRLVKGRWTKASPTEPTRLVDALGTPIRLQAGRTWVELLPVGAPVEVSP